jgi:hypothetical protein
VAQPQVLAIALGLAQEGASVIVNGRSEERVAQAIAKIQQSKPEAQVSGVVADAGKLLRIQLALSGRAGCPPHNHLEKILLQIKGATAYCIRGRATFTRSSSC